MATSLNSSSNPPLDTWDQRKPDSQKAAAAPVVRDNWEDDDESDDNIDHAGGNGEQISPNLQNPAENAQAEEDVNKKIWEAANVEVASPMPTLVPSRTGSVIPPPAAAFQPAMRILRRPQSSSPSQGSPRTSSPPTGESLQEREARYAAARERIFGLENSDNSEVVSPNVQITKESKAPESVPGKQTQSFGLGGKGRKTA